MNSDEYILMIAPGAENRASVGPSPYTSPTPVSLRPGTLRMRGSKYVRARRVKGYKMSFPRWDATTIIIN